MSNTKAPLNTQFREKQFYDAYPPGIELQYWHVARNRIVERHLRAIPAQRVLDVGCGRGILVEYLLARGMDAYGVELSPVPVSTSLRGRIFGNLAAEALDEPFRASVDTLVLGDVIEHLPDPSAYLHTLLEAYKNTEALVLTVPARQEIWSNYDEYYGHYLRYDLKSLGNVVRAIAFTPVELGYFFRLLYPPALFLRWLGASRQTALAAPRRTGVHRIIAALCEAEYRVCPRWIPGTSAICVAVRARAGSP